MMPLPMNTAPVAVGALPASPGRPALGGALAFDAVLGALSAPAASEAVLPEGEVAVPTVPDDAPSPAPPVDDVASDLAADTAVDVAPGAVPEIVPDVTAEVAPEIAPGVKADSVQDVAPDGAADAGPEMPDMIADPMPEAEVEVTPAGAGIAAAPPPRAPDFARPVPRLASALPENRGPVSPLPVTAAPIPAADAPDLPADFPDARLPDQAGVGRPVPAQTASPAAVSDPAPTAPAPAAAVLPRAEMPAAPMPAPTPPPAAPLPVARQVADAVLHITGDSTEIVLAPEELGRLRIVISRDQGGLLVTLTAERPEALDLLRRHGEALRQDLSRQGDEGARLDFQMARQGEGRDPGAGQPMRMAQAGPAGVQDGAPQMVEPMARPAIMPGRIDMRM